MDSVLEMGEHAAIGLAGRLDCPLETVRRRVGQTSHRPLARDMQRFEELYYSRRPAYARADYRIAIESDDPSVAVEAVLNLPLFT